ncbi:MAG: hypothetical protein JXA49_05460 [Actinobacteria bacterium]|nr:hypothetical protein [Actinomycetota bacterium]
MFEMVIRLFLYNLLLGVGLALRLLFAVASLRSGSFRDNLKHEVFTLLIKSNDLDITRHYRLEGGRFKSKAADCQNPDLSIVWSDSKAFARTFFNLNPLAIVRGFAQSLTSGSVAVKVNMEAAQVFFLAMGEMIGVYMNFFRFDRRT